MKVLPEGTTKYIVFNDIELTRNIQRRNGGAPAVVVAEADDTVRGGYVFHTGFGLLTDSPVVAVFGGTNGSKVLFEYPTGYFGRRAKVRAALLTTGKVAIAESADEALSVPSPAPKTAAANQKPKAAKATEEKSK